MFRYSVSSNYLRKFLVAPYQPAVRPIDEHGALMYAGRWGIYGVTLPGRVTFAPGNVGFVTFGAPRPMEVTSIYNAQIYLSHNVEVLIIGSFLGELNPYADTSC